MGWVGNVLILIGALLIGHKYRSAFLFSSAGNLAWLAQGVYVQMVDLVVISAAFAALALWNWWLWGKQVGGKGK